MRLCPLLYALALAGCGLELSGTSSPPGDSGVTVVDSGADITQPFDAGGDVVADAPEDAPNNVDSGTETACLDGKDNDGDGLVDCADPDCNPVVQCVAAAPSGWTGPSLYFDTRAQCPAGFPQEVNAVENLAPGNASCSACSCVASGGTCTLNLPFRCKKDQNCDANPDYERTTTADNTCYDPGGTLPLGPQDYCQLVAPQPNAMGTCNANPGGGVLNKQNPQYQKQSRVCRNPVAGGGCAPGLTCLAKPSAHGYCVSQTVADGQSPPSCPSGFAQAHTTSPGNNSFTDTRACTACGCSGQTVNPICTAVHRIYTSDNCGGGPSAQVAGDGQCAIVSNQAFNARSSRTTLTVAQGACTMPTGGTVTGSVTQTNVTQVCCQN